MARFGKFLIGAMLIGALCGARPADQPAPAALAPPLDNLLEIVGDADTVVFGEDSHGMTAVHEIVPRIFQALVERKGFRVFVFEAQWGLPEGLADFMNSDRTELNSTDSYWLNGAFASQPIADMLVWIRNWNRSHPRDQIVLAGYQPEQPVTDFRFLFAYLETVAPSDVSRLRMGIAACRAADPAFSTELDFITANGARTRDRQPTYSDEERAACVAGLDAIEVVLARQAPTSGAAERSRVRAGLHLLSLRNYVTVLRRSIDQFIANPNMSTDDQVRLQGEVYAAGDEARFRVYQALREMDFPGKKIFHWMHNWHAFRHASDTGELSPAELTIPHGTVSFGERLAAAEGRKLVTIGNIVPCGTSCVEPEGSLELAFADRFGDRAALIDLRRSTDGQLPIDQAGALYANHHRGGFSNVVLQRQFDALLYLPSSRMVGH